MCQARCHHTWGWGGGSVVHLGIARSVSSSIIYRVKGNVFRKTIARCQSGSTIQKTRRTWKWPGNKRPNSLISISSCPCSLTAYLINANFFQHWGLRERAYPPRSGWIYWDHAGQRSERAVDFLVLVCGASLWQAHRVGNRLVVRHCARDSKIGRMCRSQKPL